MTSDQLRRLIHNVVQKTCAQDSDPCEINQNEYHTAYNDLYSQVMDQLDEYRETIRILKEQIPQDPASTDDNVYFTLNGQRCIVPHNPMTWHELVYMARGYLPKPLSTVIYTVQTGPDKREMKFLEPHETLTVTAGMNITCHIGNH